MASNKDAVERQAAAAKIAGRPAPVLPRQTPAVLKQANTATYTTTKRK